MSDLEHIARWMSASLFKHVSDACVGLVSVHIEGTDGARDATHVELRVDGPNFSQMTPTFWEFTIRLNVLISHMHTKDLYKVERVIGQVVSALTTSIPVYKYGDGAALLDCMKRDDVVKVHRFGKPEEATKVTLAAIETVYQLQAVIS